MNWFDKKANEYIDTKLKQIDEDERNNKKSKRTIGEELDNNKWYYPLLIVLILIAVFILFKEDFAHIPLFF